METFKEGGQGKVCPCCKAVILKIEDEWICQGTCGFRSHSSEPMAWVALNAVVTLHRLALQCAEQFDAALPNNSIIQDFLKFVERM